MTEDYLLQEFHEAGIWLPEELEIIKAHKEMAQFRAEAFAKQMKMSALADLAALQHGVPLGRMGVIPITPLSAMRFSGQPVPIRQRGFLGSVIGGIFGAL